MFEKEAKALDILFSGSMKWAFIIKQIFSLSQGLKFIFIE